jgi:hypothetical protein
MSKKQEYLVKIIGDAIESLGEIPSGHLYAQVMNIIPLSEYNEVIAILKESGKVTETNHLLKWNK